MWQIVFNHISIEGWIIDPYVQSLFYCSHLVQVLPPNNVEVVDGNIVTSDVAVVIYGRGGFKMFLEPFTKSSWGLSNIFLITIHPVTLVSVVDSTLPLDWVFVFGSHQPSAPTHNCCRKKNNTWRIHSRIVSTPHGLSIGYRWNQRSKIINKFQPTEPVWTTRRSPT